MTSFHETARPQSIVFALSGLTIVIDGHHRLDANLSFREAEIWRELLSNTFPAREIEIDWCSHAGPVPAL